MYLRELRGATKVKGDIMTRSDSDIFKDSKLMCRADVPELSATALILSKADEIFFSNSETIGPAVDTQFSSRVTITDLISSLLIRGSFMCIGPSDLRYQFFINPDNFS